ncbi:MAG: hypothetical protein LBO03_05510 [Acidaminococcales bacterium]|nr:hypothetical protein [Acidaminococcales bacterium]
MPLAVRALIYYPNTKQRKRKEAKIAAAKEALGSQFAAVRPLAEKTRKSRFGKGLTKNNDNLLLRAADVCLKENRRVIIVPREMPLSRIHLRNIKEAADNGCVVFPPMRTFYGGVNSVEKQIQHIIGKLFMQLGIVCGKMAVWEGR